MKGTVLGCGLPYPVPPPGHGSSGRAVLKGKKATGIIFLHHTDKRERSQIPSNRVPTAVVYLPTAVGHPPATVGYKPDVLVPRVTRQQGAVPKGGGGGGGKETWILTDDPALMNKKERGRKNTIIEAQMERRLVRCLGLSVTRPTVRIRTVSLTQHVQCSIEAPTEGPLPSRGNWSATSCHPHAPPPSGIPKPPVGQGCPEQCIAKRQSRNTAQAPPPPSPQLQSAGHRQ